MRRNLRSVVRTGVVVVHLPGTVKSVPVLAGACHGRPPPPTVEVGDVHLKYKKIFIFISRRYCDISLSFNTF